MLALQMKTSGEDPRTGRGLGRWRSGMEAGPWRPEPPQIRALNSEWGWGGRLHLGGGGCSPQPSAVWGVGGFGCGIRGRDSLD